MGPEEILETFSLRDHREHATLPIAISNLILAISSRSAPQASDLAGLAGPAGRMLMLLCAPVAAGLAVALTASLRTAGPAGALADWSCWPAWWEVIWPPGRCSGALTAATTVPAAHAALATAAGHWTLIAAALAGAVALALACIGRRRTGARPSPGRSRDTE
jgi:hypothetical protein